MYNDPAQRGHFRFSIMILSFIGMSGSGKTHWARKLEQSGFKRYSCDELIEEKLGNELMRLGYCGINDLAKWLGQPYESHYRENSQIYLRLEREAMQDIYTAVQKRRDEDSIIDTTGSVICMPEEILTQLRSVSYVLYLSTPRAVEKEMFAQYLADPKPVIWESSFAKQVDESCSEALERCYPLLLASRKEKYKQLAHRTISYSLMRNEEFNQNDFLERIRSHSGEVENLDRIH